MIDFLEKIGCALYQALEGLIEYLDPFLVNLDPSLFQNVIIGILMLLIFIGEQIFSEVKTQDKRGEFSKMVIFYEILNITTTAVLAILSIFIIAFFKDSIDGEKLHSVSTGAKTIVLLFTALTAFILINQFLSFKSFLGVNAIILKFPF